MKRMKWNRKTLLLSVMGLVLLTCLPAVASAQGRGRGQDKKLGKFVNGHDARDGRWDGRGPRGVRVGRRFRDDRVFYPRGRRINQGHVILIPRNRAWRVDRDGDGDIDRHDYLLGRQNNRLMRVERRSNRRHLRQVYFRRR